MDNIYRHILKWKEERRKMALCLITHTKGSTPRKPGAKMLVRADGFIVGTIGGGGLEKKVIDDAIKQISLQKTANFEHALVHDHGMCCGGSVHIYIEPIMSKKPLFIFGAGHIGKALAEFAFALDFDVSLIDQRPDIFDNWSTDSYKIFHQSPALAFEKLQFDEETFIAVMTHDHALDREIVAHCAPLPHAYLGMIGSERKVEIAKKTFRSGALLSEDQMSNIDWPMGLSIKVDNPKEIAISILGKIIDVRSLLKSQLS